MQKFAIFDIDGTIFRSSLLIELMEALIHEGVLPAKTIKAYADTRSKWLNREGSYEDYINAVVCAFELHIKGISVKRLKTISNQVVARSGKRIYRYTRDLIKTLHAKNYFLLAISNSPLDIVTPFCKNLGFNKVYARRYETNDKGKFTGKIQYLDLISDKAKILKRAIVKENLTLKNSIGIGDSEADIPFLKLVANPICFNPNQKLYTIAKRRGWKIIVERKDVIYRKIN